MHVEDIGSPQVGALIWIILATKIRSLDGCAILKDLETLEK